MATEYLEIAALVVGVGVPTVTLIYSAGKAAQWKEYVDGCFKRVFDHQNSCEAERKNVEVKLFERIDRIESDVSYQRGRVNGARGRAPSESETERNVI